MRFRGVCRSSFIKKEKYKKQKAYRYMSRAKKLFLETLLAVFEKEKL